MLLGNKVAGAPHELESNIVYMLVANIPDGKVVYASAITALIDCQGPGALSGDASVIPVIYANNKLIVKGPPVAIESGAGPLWRTFKFEPTGFKLDATINPVGLALLPVGPSNAIRLYAITPTVGIEGIFVPAPGGIPPDDLVVGSDAEMRGSLVMDVFEAVQVPANVDDLALSRLPWDMTQRAFGTSGALPSTRQAATAGWHGSTTDPEQGAVCVMRSDGPLAELVGERVQVSYRIGTQMRRVVIFAHDEQDFPGIVADEDLSLSKGAFRRLAPLASESISVEVSVMA